MNLIKAMGPFTRKMYLHAILHVVSLTPYVWGPRPITSKRECARLTCAGGTARRSVQDVCPMLQFHALLVAFRDTHTTRPGHHKSKSVLRQRPVLSRAQRSSEMAEGGAVWGLLPPRCFQVPSLPITVQGTSPVRFTTNLFPKQTVFLFPIFHES